MIDGISKFSTFAVITNSSFSLSFTSSSALTSESFSIWLIPNTVARATIWFFDSFKIKPSSAFTSLNVSVGRSVTIAQGNSVEIYFVFPLIVSVVSR